MYAIRPATAADQAAAVEFIAGLQADPAHHIGYHGMTSDEVAEELADIRPDWATGALLATDRAGALRALLSVEADPQLGRAWLHGPFVDVPEGHPAARQCWHNAADELFDHAMTLDRLRGITDLELFGHRQNRRLGDFAARHGFTTKITSRVFTLTGSALRSVLISAVSGTSGPRPLDRDPELRAQVVELHERSFPKRNTSGAQLVAGERGHTVVVLTGADGLIGYAAGFAQHGELYVDYVAVDPNMRAAGSGRALVRALLRALVVEHGPRPQAAAVIALGNDASERMVTALGFELHLELVGYLLVRPGVTE
ncbi:MAG: GNAT family N-acetyltransferase [Actinomycetota bacterium]|nr:GNAT family N-acetyltransferase [Actinomycetota bacterium]